MRSVGLRVHHAGEGVARQHDAVVVDVGGLGQAGGARGVDVERAILDGQRRALGRGRARRRAARRSRGRGGESPALSPCDQTFGLVFSSGRAVGELRGELGCDDDVLRRDDVDAMGERGADQVGVDQRRDAAGAGDADPGRHVFRPVRHQQAHRLALGEILAAAPSARSGWPARRARDSSSVSRSEISAGASPYLSASSSITTGNTRVGFLAIGVVILQRALRAAQEDDVVLDVDRESSCSRLAPARPGPGCNTHEIDCEPRPAIRPDVSRGQS